MTARTDTGGPGPAPGISVRGVVRHFGSEAAPVLAGIDLDVDAGTFVALVGPSGSGKTTLLNLVAALDRPDDGTVTVGGTDVSTLGDDAAAAWRRSTVSSIFQAKGLVAHLSARENVDLALRLTRTADGTGADVDGILSAVGLDQVADHRPGQLSGGQQQRVAIARGLVTGRLLLVADEPTAELDTGTGERMIELLVGRIRSRGVTALIATHDDAVMEAADRVVRLVDGRLAPGRDVATGPIGGDR